MSIKNRISVCGLAQIVRTIVMSVGVITFYSLPTYAQDKPELPSLPNEVTMDILIRTTILTLNNANLSGNYSVLKDLGAPGFQLTNSSAKLAMSFTELRGRKVDLSPIIAFRPNLVKKPEILDNGLLRLTGYIPTKPEQVNFDLAYQLVGNRWRLFGISVNLSAAVPTADSKSKISTSSTGGTTTNPKEKITKKVTKKAEPKTSKKK